MICGCCGVGEIKKALTLFDKMKLEGFQPNEFTWNALIAYYARRGNSLLA